MAKSNNQPSGHGAKLPRQQERAICALLSETTIEKAAAKVGVSDRTLRRWISEDSQFRAAYRRARLQIVEQAVGRLQRATGKAVSALVRNLRCGKPGDEIRAALGLLDQATKAVELLDLEERLTALEQQGNGDAEGDE